MFCLRIVLHAWHCVQVIRCPGQTRGTWIKRLSILNVKIMSILTYTIVLFGNWSLSLNHGMLSILSPHPCPMLPVPTALHAGSLQMGQ